MLVFAEDGRLSPSLHWLLGIYARAFNRKYSRVGHVFQERFRAKVVASETYLWEVCRYIHMNPVKPGLAARPEDWRWSSMEAYLGGIPRLPLFRDVFLAAFSSRAGAEDFYQFTVARCESEPGAWYLEDPDAAACPEAPPPIEPHPDSVALVLAEVARELDCPVDRLCRPSRIPGEGLARAVAMLALRERLGLTLSEVGQATGCLAGTVANALTRLRRRIPEDKKLQEALGRLGLTYELMMCPAPILI
jgi:hypothetical protein